MKKIVVLIFCTFLAVISITCYTYRDEIFADTNKKNEYETDINSGNENEENDIYKNFKSITNFKLENLDRYIKYKELNPNYDEEKIVTYVNIGLDYDFYDYINDADLNKGILVLTNKYVKLPSSYEPNDLEEISDDYFISGNSYVRNMRSDAKNAFEKLSDDSIKNGTPVYGQSAYRSYSKQEILYNNAVDEMGKEKADNDTARAGHSEHQTGLTIDVSSNKSGDMLSFDETDSFKWMQENAHKYGFILRYPLNKTDITGFMYESWHYRYVGVDVAKDMHDNYPDLTYDEYYYKFIDNK